MSKAEELIKAFQAANEKYSAAVDAEQNDRELERLYNEAHDALLDYVPEKFIITPEMIERGAISLCSSSPHTMSWEKLPEHYKQDFRDEAKDVLEYALDGKVPEKTMSINEERMTQEFFYQELGQMREADFMKEKRIIELTTHLTELVEQIEGNPYAYKENAKKARKLLRKGIYE